MNGWISLSLSVKTKIIVFIDDETFLWPEDESIKSINIRKCEKKKVAKERDESMHFDD